MKENTQRNPAARIPEDEQKAEVIRVEANLEEMPVFSATKRSRKEEIVTWKRQGRDPKSGLPVEQEMVIRPARGLGLPGQVERDLYYLVISPWVESNGFGADGTIGPISYSEALKRLGWQRSGQNYGKIREALRTLVSLNFEFKNCIIDGESREFEQFIYGHLFEKVAGIEEKAPGSDRAKRGEFVILAADWFVKSHRHSYVKPLDISVYRSLDTPVAQSLYTYLDKRAYSWRRKGYEREVVEDIFELRERFRLGVQKTKHLLERFRKAHADLMPHWPILHEARIEKLGPGRYQCVYVFDVQFELPLREQQSKRRKKNADLPPLAVEMVERGMTPDIARRLAGKYPEDQIRRQLDIHDQEQKQGTKHTNPGGRLRKRIEEDWASFKGYRSPEDREKASEKVRAARQQQEEEEDRRVNWWKYQTPEQRARDYASGQWGVSWKLQHGFEGEPSEEEKQEAYEEALERFRAEALAAQEGPQNAPGGPEAPKDDQGA